VGGAPGVPWGRGRRRVERNSCRSTSVAYANRPLSFLMARQRVGVETRDGLTAPWRVSVWEVSEARRRRAASLCTVPSNNNAALKLNFEGRGWATHFRNQGGQERAHGSFRGAHLTPSAKCFKALSHKRSGSRSPASQARRFFERPSHEPDRRSRGLERSDASAISNAIHQTDGLGVELCAV
jgi:hypothetical protein